MPGFMPGIHVLGISSKQEVDGRDKPGHDGSLCFYQNVNSFSEIVYRPASSRRKISSS